MLLVIFITRLIDFVALFSGLLSRDEGLLSLLWSLLSGLVHLCSRQGVFLSRLVDVWLISRFLLVLVRVI